MMQEEDFEEQKDHGGLLDEDGEDPALTQP